MRYARVFGADQPQPGIFLRQPFNEIGGAVQGFVIDDDALQIRERLSKHRGNTLRNKALQIVSRNNNRQQTHVTSPFRKVGTCHREAIHPVSELNVIMGFKKQL